MFCMMCGTTVADKALFCPHCGARIERPEPGAAAKPDGAAKPGGAGVVSRVAGNVVNQVNAVYGTQEQVDLKFSDFFSEVRKRHTHDEAEQTFICGTATTTPDIRVAGREWPKPWLYSRVLLLLAVTFVGCAFIASALNNPNSIPGFIVVGSFMVPVSTMVFFFEANAPRNISFLDVLKMFFLGGVGSIIAIYPMTLVLGPGGVGSLIPAMITSVLEELAKLALVAYFMSRRPGRNYILNGLLVGAAVGAGFAAFESAGYAFNGYMTPWIEYMAQGVTLDSMSMLQALYARGYSVAFSNIIMRGVLAVGGHVAWAAVEGAGVAIASDGKAFDWTDLLKRDFLILFAFPVVCHGVWDWMPLTQHGLIYVDIVLLVVAIWVLILVLLRRGMVEVNHAARDAEPLAPPSLVSWR